MQGFINSRWFIAITALLYLLLTGVIVWLIFSRTKPEIEVMLTWLIPSTLRVNFLLIVLGLLLLIRDRAHIIQPIFNRLFSRSASAALPGSASSDRPFFTTGIWLALILIVGVLLVSQVAPQIHRIYYDEDIYANMAQNIAFTNQAGMANYGNFEYGEYFVHWLTYNKDPAGWPFLMSLVFQLFGAEETLAFYLNNALFVGGIVVVFFMTRLFAGGSLFAALLAALVYAVTPHNLIWANTISAENSAAVFGGLVVLSALVWLKKRKRRHLFLMAVMLPFACNIRPESSLIAFVVLAAVALNLFGEKPAKASDILPHPEPDDSAFPRPHPFANRIFWAMGLFSFALIIPLILHFYAMSGQSWGAEGAKFAGSYFVKNITVNGLYFLNNKEFPFLFSVFVVIGLFAWTLGDKGGFATTDRNGEERVNFRSPLLLLLWFLLFWGIFLFFYAGSYKYGADVRFALVTFMPLSVLAGMGGNVLRVFIEKLGKSVSSHGYDAPAAIKTPAAAILVFILLISWMKFLPLIRTVGQEAWGARHDHEYAHEFIQKIPRRSVILTHIPTMFLIWGQNAIQAYAGINNPDIIQNMLTRYNGHVYFHKSYWCNTQSDGDGNRNLCDTIAAKYNLEPVVVAHEQNHEYGLYRMTIK